MATLLVATATGTTRLVVDHLYLDDGHLNPFLIKKASMSADDLTDCIQRLLSVAVIYHHREPYAYGMVMQVVGLLTAIDRCYPLVDEERSWYLEDTIKV